jgi:hypothetical protein
MHTICKIKIKITLTGKNLGSPTDIAAIDRLYVARPGAESKIIPVNGRGWE